MKNKFKNRYALVFAFLLLYITLGFLVRETLAILSAENLTENGMQIFIVFLKGFLFDVCVALCFVLLYSLYLLMFPSKWIGSKIDVFLNYFIITLLLFVALFSFAAEFPFWDEFKTRFNFIAVDYLIYTYEVVQNINQSYPIPLLIGGLAICIFLIVYFFSKKRRFQLRFFGQNEIQEKIVVHCDDCGFWIGIVVFCTKQTSRI